MKQLLEKTIQQHIEPDAVVLTATEFTGEQGYSGAAVRYFDVQYKTAVNETANIKLVVKDAPLVGRKVLQLLGQQVKTAVPFSSANDLETDRAQPICQQFIPTPCKQLNPAQLQQLAQKLAKLHATNLNKPHEFNWLPKINIAYFQDFIFADWRKQWQLTNQDTTFAAKFGKLHPQIEAAANQFLAEMAKLHQNRNTVTLIHADLHHDHIRFDADELYLIDFDDARYGTFYLDLPNLFDQETVQFYKKALDSLVETDDSATFAKRFKIANQYVGFKYMGFSLWRWREGDEGRDQGLMRMINRALGNKLHERNYTKETRRVRALY